MPHSLGRSCQALLVNELARRERSHPSPAPSRRALGDVGGTAGGTGRYRKYECHFARAFGLDDGAGGGGRTHKSVRTADFESAASANSATPAGPQQAAGGLISLAIAAWPASGRVLVRSALDDHDARRGDLQGHIRAKEHADEPLRRETKTRGLDAAKRTHGIDPILKAQRNIRRVRCLSHADRKHPVHGLQKFRSNFAKAGRARP